MGVVGFGGVVVVVVLVVEVVSVDLVEAGWSKLVKVLVVPSFIAGVGSSGAELGLPVSVLLPVFPGINSSTLRKSRTFMFVSAETCKEHFWM